MIEIIAEVGINHNGDLSTAFKLIDVAADAGCNAVKFQKRTIEAVYTPEELAAPRVSPFGTTNGEQKYGLEFSFDEMATLKSYAHSKGLRFGASAWDPQALTEVEALEPDFHKVASAMLTCTPLLEQIASYGRLTYVSIGMSEEEEIRDAIEIFRDANCPIVLMYTCSQYPSENHNIFLKRIQAIRDCFGEKAGYSGHERGLQISVAAAALGAVAIERHITLDRAMYGSDQAASIEPDGIKRLVRDIRIVEEAMGTDKFFVLEEEKPIRAKLANPYWMTK